MKKLYVIMACLILILTVGCRKNTDVEIGSDVVIIKNSDIVGRWELEKAVSAKDGTEMFLVELYGSGIKYGGEVIFHENGETEEYIGITSGEEIESKIIYEIDKNIIKVTCNGNLLREYEYSDIDGNISLKSYRERDDELSHYLYFVKKKRLKAIMKGIVQIAI